VTSGVRPGTETLAVGALVRASTIGTSSGSVTPLRRLVRARTADLKLRRARDLGTLVLAAHDHRDDDDDPEDREHSDSEGR
jgi:hypothetical protein